MRLIDADALEYEKTEDCLDEEGDFIYSGDELVCFKDDIDCAPVIDAIPVSWIRKKEHLLREAAKMVKSYSILADILRDLLEEWSKEGNKEGNNDV